jgi:abortive infection bacteriophage resistance protein
MYTQTEKPAKTPAEHVKILQDRGIEVLDPVYAERMLRIIGYYRYSYHVRIYRLDPNSPTNLNYVSGTPFSYGVDLYEVDRELRKILAEGILLLEQVVFTSVADHIALSIEDGTATQALDKLVHKRGETLRGMNFDNPVIRHHRKYSGIPIWVTMLFISYGYKNELFKNMNTANRQKVADEIGFADEGNLTKILNSFRVLRNACAHNGTIFPEYVETTKPSKTAPRESVTFTTVLGRYNNSDSLAPYLYWLCYSLRKTDYGQDWIVRMIDEIKGLHKSYPNINVLGILELNRHWQSDMIAISRVL